MKRITLLTGLAAVTLILATSQPGFTKGDGKSAGGQMKSGSSHEMSHDDSGHHDKIESGRDFGQHVKEMNDHFSGDHNPGKHHKGYSGIKK